MLGETEFTLDIRPTFVDELDKGIVQPPNVVCDRFGLIMKNHANCAFASMSVLYKSFAWISTANFEGNF